MYRYLLYNLNVIALCLFCGPGQSISRCTGACFTNSTSLLFAFFCCPCYSISRMYRYLLYQLNITTTNICHKFLCIKTLQWSTFSFRVPTFYSVFLINHCFGIGRKIGIIINICTYIVNVNIIVVVNNFSIVSL